MTGGIVLLVFQITATFFAMFTSKSANLSIQKHTHVKDNHREKALSNKTPVLTK